MRSPRAVLLGALAIVLLGCAAPPSAPSTTGSTPPTAPAARIKTITAALALPILGMSGLSISGAASDYVELHSNGLATTDARGRPIPRIASELPTLESGTIRLLPDGRMTTEWRLRPDVTWHDGTPFTSRDVAFGFRVQADRELAFPAADRSAVSRIDAVEPTDAHTVLIHWRAPYYLAGSLGNRLLFPLPAHILASSYETGDKQFFLTLPYWTSHYVHTGAFRLARFEQGVGATFEAYDAYFLGRPKVDRVIIREILDTNASYAAVLVGDIDVTIEVFEGEGASNLQGHWEAAGRGRVSSTPGALNYAMVQLAPDLASPSELLDPRIRRALYLALDRAELTSLGWGGRPAPWGEARGLYPVTNPLYAYVGDNLANSASDPARASQAFADAGWTPGADGLLVSSSGARLGAVEIRVASNRVARAAVVADMWRRAGVDTSIAPTSGAQQQDRQFRQSAPGVQITSSGYEDAGFAKYDGNEQPTARTGYSGANLGHYDNPRTTELIERFRVTLNEPERGQLVKQVADLVAQDLPLLPFFHNPQYVTVSRGVRALDDIDGARALITGGYAREAHLWEKD